MAKANNTGNQGMQKTTRMLGIAALLSLTGCSTIVGERYNHVNIATVPSGAAYEVVRTADNAIVAQGVTPNLVKLKSSAGYFKRGSYSVRLHKDGYQDTTVPLSAGMRGTYWANIIFGGPIGLLIVDPASGAMWALPKTLDARLQLNTDTPPAPTPQPAAMQAATPVESDNSRAQQLYELQQQNLSYEEYQRRYKVIMEQ